MDSTSPRYAIGADTGATKTILLLLGPEGEVVAREKYPSREDGRPLLDNLVLHVNRLVEGAGVDPALVAGTGVGVPAIVDAEGVMLRSSPVLGREGENIRQLLLGRVPGEVRVDNDVNMAAVGESWKGAAVGAHDAVLITVGTFLGAAIVMDGRLRRGQHGAAGEIGVMGIDPYADAPIDPYAGPLEALVGGHGIARVARERFADFPGTSLSRDAITSEAVFQAAAEGDPLALAVTDDAYRHLSFAIANTIALIAPEIVVIGGGVSRVGAPYLEEVRRRVAALCVLPHRIELAGLGEDAGAYGAAATVHPGYAPHGEDS